MELESAACDVWKENKLVKKKQYITTTLSASSNILC
jgi:hypothetical protein